MKHSVTLGLDYWCYHGDMDHFLNRCIHRGIAVYEVKQKNGNISFYTSFFQRHEVEKTFEQARFVKTTGCLGLLFRILRSPRHLLSIGVSIALWYWLSHMVFAIDLIGEKQASKQVIQDALTDMNVQVPFYSMDILPLKTELKKRCENDIAWLEIVKEGSRYVIYYTPKEFADVKELGRDELIAQKDGVIAEFDLQHGNKNVQLNDYVHAGDVLVSNVLIDSMNQPEDIYVKGKVYAYTWQDITVTMEDNDLPEAFQFYQLLLEARREVAKELTKEKERIYKENILHFSADAGTISMTIHYTLFEDITSP